MDATLLAHHVRHLQCEGACPTAQIQHGHAGDKAKETERLGRFALLEPPRMIQHLGPLVGHGARLLVGIYPQLHLAADQCPYGKEQRVV